MKRNNAGSSLVEIVVATAIMGILVGAVCTSLMFGLRLNEKTDAQLKAQLAVSSVVETLMAEGIDPALVNEGDVYSNPQITENVRITAETKCVTKQITASIHGSATNITVEVPLHYYEVEVISNEADVSITTHIREKKAVTGS